jgi:K+-transporting ATPase KdpF subunit
VVVLKVWPGVRTPSRSRRAFSRKTSVAQPVGLKTGDLRTKGFVLMIVLAGVLTLGLFAYLVYALIKPEKF